MPTSNVMGTDIYFEDSGGDLPPVVFLHGFLFDGRQYQAQVDALRDGYRCITVDFPGQGRSGRSTVGYSTERLTEVVTAFLDQQALARVHLVGLSMGGFTSMRIAARRPDLVSSLTLLNTSARPHARSKFPRQLALAAITLAVGTSVPPVTHGIEAEMYGAVFRADSATEQLRDQWRTCWARSDRIVLVQTLLGLMGRRDFRDDLARIAAPTLIVAGEHDISLPPAQSVEISERIPGAQLVVLPNVGHSAPLEDPDGVTEAMRAFWAMAAEPA